MPFLGSGPSAASLYNTPPGGPAQTGNLPNNLGGNPSNISFPSNNVTRGTAPYTGQNTVAPNDPQSPNVYPGSPSSNNPWGASLTNGQPTDYFSLSPAQQQAWSNGSISSWLAGTPAPTGPTSPKSTDPLAGNTWQFGGTPNFSAQTSNFQGTPISVPSLDTLEAQQASYANNPYLSTPAYLATQAAADAGASPLVSPSNWQSLTNSQKLALQYRGQYPDALPGGTTQAGLMQQYQGPTTGLNNPIGSVNPQQLQQAQVALAGGSVPGTVPGAPPTTNSYVQQAYNPFNYTYTGQQPNYANQSYPTQTNQAPAQVPIITTPLGYTQYNMPGSSISSLLSYLLGGGTGAPSSAASNSGASLQSLMALLSGFGLNPSYLNSRYGLGGL